MKTQVGIIGAGPAGLMLSHLLHLEGIESIIVEAKSRDYVEQRVRAGVLEHGTTELLYANSVGERMRRESLQHDGIQLLFGGELRRIDFHELTGKRVTVYGQQEVVKDLIAARLAAGGTIVFDAHDVTLTSSSIHYRDAQGTAHEIECEFLAGCDGFHGISRAAVPAAIYERVYPFAWLGILAESKPASEELIYALHDRGFALLSLRSPTISRLYLQCAPDEDLAQWSDARIWDELSTRLSGGAQLVPGTILQRGVTPMRSFVAEPMQHGRLFLAGDSAHIVPPTGAKGMNLAIADARVLAGALAAYFQQGDEAPLRDYSRTCLRHVWRAQHFSWWMTSMLHRVEGAHQQFDMRRQRAELDLVTRSRDASRLLAENYADACQRSLS